MAITTENSNFLIITDSIDAYETVDFLYYLEDAEEKYDSSTILLAPFRKLEKKRAIWGEKNTPFWFKIILKNGTESNQDIVFDITYENINKAEFFIAHSTDSIAHLLHINGNTIAYSEWPIQNRFTPFPYTIVKGEQTVFMIRAEYSREVQFPMMIRKRENYFSNELKQRHILGMYTGYLIMIILLNLFFFFSFRENIFISSGIFLFCKKTNPGFVLLKLRSECFSTRLVVFSFILSSSPAL